jgi:hypothetical protein
LNKVLARIRFLMAHLLSGLFRIALLGMIRPVGHT